MTIQTRSAQQSDYEWLYSLNLEVYQHLITLEFGYWDEEEELALFQEAWESQKIMLITIEEERAGMFILSEQDDHLWLSEIQIAPQFQNCGLGSQVIQQLLAKSHQKNRPLRLRVLHANYRAYRLYQRLGFRRISTAKHHHVMEA